LWDPCGDGNRVKKLTFHWLRAEPLEVPAVRVLLVPPMVRVIDVVNGTLMLIVFPWIVTLEGLKFIVDIVKGPEAAVALGGALFHALLNCM
jgi:hypothetical protein